MSGAKRLVTAEDRLRRLLVMLPWLMEEGEVPLERVAERFDMSEAEVVRDLELVAMCGLPPYTDEMIDLYIDEGMVHVGVPRLFERSLRLTAPEAFSLLAATRAALELPGVASGDALRRGLDRVAGALRNVGIVAEEGVADAAHNERKPSDSTAGIEIDLSRPELTDGITEAVADRAELRIEYYSPTRDAVASRVIDPRHVFADRGNWYVVAIDEAAAERRTFRIDRIESLERTGVALEPLDNSVEVVPEFFTDVDVPRVTLRLGPEAMWVVDRYPHDAVEPAEPAFDGSSRVEVTLPVASNWWLARLLVRLGPAAEVVGDSAAADAGRGLAADILARYR